VIHLKRRSESVLDHEFSKSLHPAKAGNVSNPSRAKTSLKTILFAAPER
jgi:hypothetical protein